MFAIMVIAMCCWLFDVAMGVLTKRILGIVLLVCFILYVIYDSGLITVGSPRIH